MEAVIMPSATASQEPAVNLFLGNLNHEGTRKLYAREVKQFLDLSKKPLAQVELEDILAFKESIKSLKPATVARKLVIIKALLGFAHEQRFIARNPARLLKIPRVRPQEPDILTIAEAEALLRSPDRRTSQGRRDFAVLSLLLSSGIREAELCSLNVGDVAQKWSHHVLAIQHGKGGKSRSMALPKAAGQAVEDYLKGRGSVKPEEPLFLTLGVRGMAPSRLTPRAVDHLVAVHAKRALIAKKISTHLLRHVACSFSLAAGASPKEVMAMAGHSSLAITNRYVHLLESVSSAAQKNPLFKG